MKFVTLKLNGQLVLTDKEKRAELQAKLWNEYLTDNEQSYAQLINYYQVHLVDILIDKLRVQYRDNESKAELQKVCMANLHKAFNYSMYRGFSYAFEWLCELTLPIDLKLFGKESFHNTIMLQCQGNFTNGNVLSNTLKNHFNSAMLSYLDKYCENVFDTFIDISEVMFFKGFNQAVDSIQNYYQIPSEKAVMSSLTKLPANKSIQMTPAMRGEYLYGDSNMELWGLKWDIAYNRYDYLNNDAIVHDNTNMIVNVLLTNLEIVKNNAKLHVLTDEKVLAELKERHIKKAKTDAQTPILILEYMLLPAINDDTPNNTSKGSRIERLINDSNQALSKVEDQLKEKDGVKVEAVNDLSKAISNLNYTLQSPKQMTPSERIELEKIIKEKFTKQLNVFPSNCVTIYDN